MNTRVRAPRPMQQDALLRHPPEYTDDFSLDRGLIGLHLPAMEVGTVVGNGELEITHAREWIPGQGAVRTKRLPGLVAALPSRQKGQSSGS